MLRSLHPYILTSSDLTERLRIGPLSELSLIVTALVDKDLSVLSQHNARALQGAGRRALEIDAAQTIPAPVARALELVLCRKIVRCASQMRADGNECEEPARV